MLEYVKPPAPVIPNTVPFNDPGPVPPKAAPVSGSGTVSVEDALKGAEHTKQTQFTVSDLSKGPNTSGPQSASNAFQSGSSVSVGNLVQSKVAVEWMDSLIPALLVLIFHKLKVTVKKSDFQLTQGEKNTLYPIVEACMQQLMINFESPWSALCVTIIIIYGGKGMEKGGVALMDRKAAEVTPAKAPEARPPVAPMRVVPPVPSAGPKATSNTDSFGSAMDVVQQDGPPVWTEADVAALMRAPKKFSRKKALEWLETNWAKKGGRV